MPKPTRIKRSNALNADAPYTKASGEKKRPAKPKRKPTKKESSSDDEEVPYHYGESDDPDEWMRSRVGSVLAMARGTTPEYSPCVRANASAVTPNPEVAVAVTAKQAVIPVIPPANPTSPPADFIDPSSLPAPSKPKGETEPELYDDFATWLENYKSGRFVFDNGKQRTIECLVYSVGEWTEAIGRAEESKLRPVWRFGCCKFEPDPCWHCVARKERKTEIDNEQIASSIRKRKDDMRVLLKFKGAPPPETPQVQPQLKPQVNPPLTQQQLLIRQQELQKELAASITEKEIENRESEQEKFLLRQFKLQQEFQEHMKKQMMLPKH